LIFYILNLKFFSYIIINKFEFLIIKIRIIMFKSYNLKKIKYKKINKFP